MQLRYSPASPFVRKVLVLALETGLGGSVQQITTNPWDPDTDLVGDNPLGKVPALLRDDELALFDSRVVCEYLDSLHDGPLMFPASGEPRWAALRWQALGDGVMDAAVAAFVELTRRPEERRWPVWVERQLGSVGRALQTLEKEVVRAPAQLHVGQIAVGCALGYLDFRHSQLQWRHGHRALADWHETLAARESFRQTVPREPA
ncbi:MAG: glutathione S-transferase N-terminal domain-containing protein [Gammaproteobacteria bacterium]|nr:glutathione S-transferase N-terminal domain-containing protein [Gammaproteobacteria bacterium]